MKCILMIFSGRDPEYSAKEKNMNSQYISSKTNPLVLRFAKLKDKKYRREERLFRFDGIKLFCEALEKEVPLEYVIICKKDGERLLPQVGSKITEYGSDAGILVLAESVFSKLTDEKSSEGIICVAKYLDKLHKTDTIESVFQKSGDINKERILLLESVRDAGNLGTIIRSANAFGIDRLIISADCADIYNPKTVRAAMGALFAQKINVAQSIPEAVDAMRASGYRVFAAALDKNAKRLGSFPLCRGDAVLIGNEGHGLSKDALEACEECIFIPMNEGAESLNASVAASVCMWELYRSGK